MKQKPQSQEQLMITVPAQIRDKLRTIAAQINFENPKKVTSASEVVRSILIEYFKDEIKLNER